MRYNFIPTWLLAVALISSATTSHADEIPGSWKRTMTNDPSTNYFLAKITKPLGSQDAELLRTVMVSGIAIKYCKDVKLNTKVADAFLLANGYYAIHGKRWQDAQFAARDNLRNMTDREVAHLCAGLGHLFGPNGVLAPNLVQFGASEFK